VECGGFSAAGKYRGFNISPSRYCIAILFDLENAVSGFRNFGQRGDTGFSLVGQNGRAVQVYDFYAYQITVSIVKGLFALK